MDSDSREKMFWKWQKYEYYATPPLLVKHGHQADEFNSGIFSAIGEEATKLYALLERLGWTTPGRMDDKAFGSVENNYLTWAKKQLADSGANLFIYGHTHRPFLLDMGDGHAIMNCGSFVPPRVPTVGFVDGTHVELLEVTDADGTEME